MRCIHNCAPHFFAIDIIEFTSLDIIDTRRSQKREQGLKGLKIYDFYEYLKQKRLDKEITLRGFAKLVDISPVYLCDLEKGRKAAPSMEVMQKMVSKLALNKEESERFYDLAALEQTAKIRYRKI